MTTTPEETPAPKPKIPARQILLVPQPRVSARSTFGPAAAYAQEGTVLAEDVSVETDHNRLTSTNLQDALDFEIAPRLSEILAGGRWRWTSVPNSETAELQFSDNAAAFTIESGSVLQIAGQDPGFGPGASFFTGAVALDTGLLDDNLFHLTGSVTAIQATGIPQYYELDSVLQVMSKSQDRIVMYSGMNGARILTRITE